MKRVIVFFDFFKERGGDELKFLKKPNLNYLKQIFGSRDLWDFAKIPKKMDVAETIWKYH